MPKSIFVVDDVQQSLGDLAIALAEAGYAPVISPASADAVAAFVEVKPELVFVSLHTVDPAAVCEGIRSDPDGAIVPIVLVGDGHSEVRSPADALHHGADYYFGLPLEIAKVLAKVRTYIGGGEKTPQVVRSLSSHTVVETATGEAAAAVPTPAFLPPTAPPPASAGLPPPHFEGSPLDSRAQPDPAVPATTAASSAPHETGSQGSSADLVSSAEALLSAIATEQSRVVRRGTEPPATPPGDATNTRANTAAEAELRRSAEAEARRLAEAELRRRIEEDARRRAEEEMVRRIEEETRRRVEEETRRRIEEETRRRVEDETRRRVEEEARRRADEEALRRVEEETRRRVEEETRRRIEEQTRRQVGEEGRQRTDRDRRVTDVGEPGRADLSRPAEPGQRIEDRPSSGAAPSVTASGAVALSPVEGLLEEAHDVTWVFFEVYRQGVTGRVDFTSETRQKSLFFERGAPVDAYSSQVSDRIEEYLLREGRITRAQYQDVRSKGLRGPRRIAAHLGSEGFLKSDELFAAVRGHLEEVVYGLFEWEEGAWRYTAERAADADRVTLDTDPRALVFEGIRRKYVLPRLMARIGGPSSVLTRVGPAGELEALRLRPEEREVARLLDGKRSVQDIVSASGLEPLRVYHVAAGLVAVAWAQVTVRGVEGARRDGSTTPDLIDRDRIADKLEQARNLDYFQVLGIARTATMFEIERAYEHNCQEFHPARFSRTLQEQMREQLAEIEQVLHEAYSVLREERLRAAYARHLPG